MENVTECVDPSGRPVRKQKDINEVVELNCLSQWVLMLEGIGELVACSVILV